MFGSAGASAIYPVPVLAVQSHLACHSSHASLPRAAGLDHTAGTLGEGAAKGWSIEPDLLNFEGFHWACFKPCLWSRSPRTSDFS